MPAWSLWLLRVHFGIVYIYAGVAKLNSDWLQGEPLRGWLAEHGHAPLAGTLLLHEWTVHAFAYGALLFDLRDSNSGPPA